MYKIQPSAMRYIIFSIKGCSLNQSLRVISSQGSISPKNVLAITRENTIIKPQ